MSADSETASCISATASRPERPDPFKLQGCRGIPDLTEVGVPTVAAIPLTTQLDLTRCEAAEILS